MSSETFGRLAFAGIVIGYLLHAFIWAAICAYVAREKDRREAWWTLFGGVGGLFIVGGLMAYLAIAAVPDLSEYEPSDRPRRRRDY